MVFRLTQEEESLKTFKNAKVCGKHIIAHFYDKKAFKTVFFFFFFFSLIANSENSENFTRKQDQTSFDGQFVHNLMVTESDLMCLTLQEHSSIYNRCCFLCNRI